MSQAQNQRATHSGADWKNYQAADYANGVLFATAGYKRPATRLVMGGVGLLYLVPVGGALADEKLYGTVAIDEVVEVQCDGLGNSTTVATEITVIF